MFQLNYSITKDDLKKENQKIALFYFALYLSVSVLGLAVGIVAVVLNPQTSVLVLGIIILVFSALLLAISVLMLIAPKNLVISAVETDEKTRSVVIDKTGITVDEQNIAAFADITKIKNRKTYLTAYIGKDKVFIIKDAISSGQSVAELLAYMSERQGKLLLTSPENQAAGPDEQAERVDFHGEQKDTVKDQADGEAEPDETGEPTDEIATDDKNEE